MDIPTIAICNTYDFTNLQGHINWLSEHGGGTIFIRPGLYRMGAQVIMKPGVSLFGDPLQKPIIMIPQHSGFVMSRGGLNTISNVIFRSSGCDVRNYFLRLYDDNYYGRIEIVGCTFTNVHICVRLPRFVTEIDSIAIHECTFKDSQIEILLPSNCISPCDYFLKVLGSWFDNSTSTDSVHGVILLAHQFQIIETSSFVGHINIALHDLLQDQDVRYLFFVGNIVTVSNKTYTVDKNVFDIPRCSINQGMIVDQTFGQLVSHELLANDTNHVFNITSIVKQILEASDGDRRKTHIRLSAGVFLIDEDVLVQQSNISLTGTGSSTTWIALTQKGSLSWVNCSQGVLIQNIGFYIIDSAQNTQNAALRSVSLPQETASTPYTWYFDSMTSDVCIDGIDSSRKSVWNRTTVYSFDELPEFQDINPNTHNGSIINVSPSGVASQIIVHYCCGVEFRACCFRNVNLNISNSTCCKVVRCMFSGENAALSLSQNIKWVTVKNNYFSDYDKLSRIQMNGGVGLVSIVGNMFAPRVHKGDPNPVYREEAILLDQDYSDLVTVSENDDTVET